MVRAKFKVVSVTGLDVDHQKENAGEVVLEPVTSGSDENEQFFRYTPSGQIRMSTINENALNAFEVGKEFYVDFTPT